MFINGLLIAPFVDVVVFINGLLIAPFVDVVVFINGLLIAPFVDVVVFINGLLIAPFVDCRCVYGTYCCLHLLLMSSCLLNVTVSFGDYQRILMTPFY